MAKQQAMGLRQVDLPELIALAYHIFLKNKKKGKSSRRITVALKPHEIPLVKGEEVETPFGKVRVKCTFSKEKAKWYVTVILPAEGFTLGDFINKDSTDTPPAK